MASGGDSLEHRLFHQAYISPLAAVRDFFDSINELRSAVKEAENERIVRVCENVSVMGEKMALCLEQQTKQHNRARETTQDVSGAFRLALQRVIQVKQEANGLKKMVRDLKLADHGLDARDTPMASQQQPATHSQTYAGYATMETQSEPLPRASSLENFRKHMDATLSSRKSNKSSESNFQMRKTKSDSDINMQTLKKKVEGLSLDNTRLRASEKKLLKDTIKLNRANKTLEQERDRAEDRLKIEQTQRDSVEKLRQRNRELEDQLRKLCQSQVIRERGGNVFDSSGSLDPKASFENMTSAET